jgi:hypothetical protein
MRVITGAHRDTPVDHLLAETQLLSVKDSLELSCKKFLANVYTLGHPSHSVVKLETGQRKGRKGGIIHTLQSRYKESIVPYLNDDIMLESNYKKSIKDIHTKAVEASKRFLVNGVLGGPPPDVHPSEKSLPRVSQTTLCQLRCDNCICLETYKLKAGTANDDLCSMCRGAPHTSSHLFVCPASPTDLNFIDIWKRPREAVDYLKSLASFNHLPPNRPYPRPPPQLPPVARGAPI